LPHDQIGIYDPTRNRFPLGPRMNDGRWLHTATVITSGSAAGKILLAGGFPEESDGVLASTELYDPATNTFAPKSATAKMITARAAQTATVISSGPNAGKILIAGGAMMNKHNQPMCGDPDECGFTPLASSELYDPATNSSEPGPSMRGAPGDAVAVQLPAAPRR
jgi:hypothetical protein